MFRISEEKNINTLFYLILIICFFQKLSSIFLNLPPYQFCDEQIYHSAVLDLWWHKKFIVDEFRAGGVNILPLLPFAYFLKNIELLVFGRFIFLCLLGTLTLRYIYLITYECTKSFQFSLASCLFYVLSPYVFSMSQFWYPDHYIYFFSSGFLYYFLALINNPKHAYKTAFFLGVFAGLMISTKITGFLLLPILFLFLVVHKKNIISNFYLYLRLFLYFSLSFFSVLTLFNYSVFFNYDLFIHWTDFNVNHYKSYKLTFMEIPFYLSYFLFMFGSVFAAPFIFFGLKHLYLKKTILFLIFFLGVLFYIILLGLNGGLVINRNISILIPFFFPLLAVGLFDVYSNLNNFKTTIKWFLISLAFLLFFFNVYFFISNLISNFSTDSRIIAKQWIEENIPQGSSIGTNKACDGLSPAENIIGLPDVEIDPKFLKNKDYYVINSYWDSLYANEYMYTKPIIFLTNQIYVHYNYWNEKNIFLARNHKSFSSNLFINDNQYSLIKTIKGNGPNIFIFKRINN